MERILAYLLVFLLLFPACKGGNSQVAHDAEMQILPREFLRGMTFAHEGYRGHNGYGGDLVGPSMDSLQQLNVNSVAIVPYTFMRGMEPIDQFPIPDHYGSENDSAVLHSIRQAQSRNLKVMLKPQIWIRGSWPGAIDYSEEEDWDTFFSAYEAWIVHYADMAERENVFALCIGTELVETTLRHPDRWRQIIRNLRNHYSGVLTYAANWGEEFENLTFWDDLDVMGLNSYYPLSTSLEPGEQELMGGARRWMQMADSISQVHDRPFWLTEVGYRSVENAWINPHAEAGDRATSPVAQARSYAALAAAVSASQRVKGMFIWKWPSYLGHQEDREGRDVGFVPGGKPAVKVLQQLYRDPPGG